MPGDAWEMHGRCAEEHAPAVAGARGEAVATVGVGKGAAGRAGGGGEAQGKMVGGLGLCDLAVGSDCREEARQELGAPEV